MSEDESDILRQVPDGTDGDLLLYDFFKHLTSLALLTLGGVLTLSQVGDDGDVSSVVLVATIVLVSAGGMLSFQGTSEIAKARYLGTRVKRVNFHRIAAPLLLAFGVGIFLSMFIEGVN